MAVLLSSTRVRVDLARPDLTRIDVRRDIAEPLARIARFGAHMSIRRADGRIWTVGQHCVVGAKALAAETGDVNLGFAFLLHDAHEAFIGDIASPVAATLGEMMGPAGRVLFQRTLAELKRRLDAEIHRIAGLTVSDRARAIVHRMDMAMLAAEARQILGFDPARDPASWPAECLSAPDVRTDGALSPWPQKRIADEWMALWDEWRIRPAAAA